MKPELFETLRDFAREIQGGKHVPREVSGSHAVPVFSENFMLQFSLQYERRCEGFNDESRKMLIAIGESATGAVNGLTIKKLAYHFEQICDRFPKGQYGGRSDVTTWLLRGWIPDLLDYAEEWARDCLKDNELTVTVRSVRTEYRGALKL